MCGGEASLAWTVNVADVTVAAVTGAAVPRAVGETVVLLDLAFVGRMVSICLAAEAAAATLRARLKDPRVLRTPSLRPGVGGILVLLMLSRGMMGRRG